MHPREYQEKESDILLKALQKLGLVYIAWQERTGKSLTSVLVVEKSLATHALVVTKSKAKKDWYQLFLDFPHIKTYDVVSYGMISKYKGKPDIVILDEAHNYISGYPKPSSTWRNVYKVVFGLPIIYISATPHAQGYQLLYHQFALSKWSPFSKYSNFYNWFRAYGKPYTIRANSREVNQYDKVDDPLIECIIRKYFYHKTRAELGFEHEPEDRLCTINLSKETKKLYNEVLDKQVVQYKNLSIVTDSTIKLRTTLHTIEGGTVKLTLNKKPEDSPDLLLCRREKIEDAVLYHCYYDLGNREKINYIRDHWGDSKNVAVMYNYKGEKVLLEREFENINILQATSNAEGIDLYQYEHLVIYSQDFSTARHTQRRARQASKARKTDIFIHFLIVHKAISNQVYKTVSLNQLNYVDKMFTGDKI